MCMGGSSKYIRRATEAQEKALEALSASQKIKTNEVVSKTSNSVKLNQDAQKRDMYSLRIPLKSKTQAITGGGVGNNYGLNIPL